MKLSRILMILAVAITSPAFSQNRELETESAIMTEHQVTVKGKRFPYRATAGTQPVWDKDGKERSSSWQGTKNRRLCLATVLDPAPPDPKAGNTLWKHWT